VKNKNLKLQAWKIQIIVYIDERHWNIIHKAMKVNWRLMTHEE